MILSDAPLERPDDDFLDRAPLARELARAILQFPDAAPFVVGVQGPWGSGKSSFLNFLDQYLLSDKPQNSKLHVFRFNPWWFSGSQDLTQHFLHELSGSLGRGRSPKYRKDIAEAVERLALAVKPISWIPGLSTSAPVIDFTAAVAASAKSGYGAQATDVREARRSIERLLEKRRLRLVVLVDDVDRLVREELLVMLQLIRGLASWRQSIFVVAHDRVHVESRLGTQEAGFLDKIIQVVFDLPVPERDQLHQVLFRGLDQMLEPLQEKQWDKGLWSRVFFEGISPLLRTQRDVIRLANACRLCYTPLRGEVFPIDFIILQALRLFYPEAYNSVAANPDDYRTSLRSAARAITSEAPESTPIEVLLETEECELRKGALKALLHYLLPADPDRKYARSQRRFLVPEWTSRYLRLRVASGELTQLDLQKYRRILGGENFTAQNDLVEELTLTRDPRGWTRLTGLLYDFAASAALDAWSVDERWNLAGALVRNATTIAERTSEDKVGPMDVTPTTFLPSLINDSLMVGTVEDARRFFFDFTDSISDPSILVASVHELEKDAQADTAATVLSQLDLSSITARLADAIDSRWTEVAAARKTLSFALVLRKWLEWGPENAKDFIRRSLKSSDGFLWILGQCVQRWVGMGGGGIEYELDLPRLQRLTGWSTEALASRAREIFAGPSESGCVHELEGLRILSRLKSSTPADGQQE